METKPEWMTDPLVSEIDEKKLQFLSELVSGGRGKSQKEAMPYMMQKLKQAKAEKISFSASEIQAVITAIKAHSTSEELEHINNLMQKAPHKS